MRRRLLLAAAAAATTAAALPAAAAHANTTCVGGPGCFPTLAAAVTDANAAPDADRIEVKAGTHAVPATVSQTLAGGPLEIDGAGRGVTFLDLTTPIANFGLKLYADGLVSDLTVNLGAGDSRFGLDVSGGAVKRVNVYGPNAGQQSSGIALRKGADAEQVAVEVAPSTGFASYGIHTDDDGDSLLRDVKVIADYAISANGSGDPGTTVVRGARLRVRYAGLSAGGAKIDADGVTVDMGEDGSAVNASSLGSHPSVIALKHATIRGPRESTGFRLAPSAEPSSSIVTAREVVVDGPQHDAKLYSSHPNALAKLDLAWSAVEPATFYEWGNGPKQVVQGPGMVTGVNLLLPSSGDPIPHWTSPLVDAGEPGPALLPANLTDVLGFARVRDGNGDGTKVRDIGAVELAPPIKIGPLPTLP